MPTCVFYVDEAGDPDRHPIPFVASPTPIFTLAAVALPIWQWRARDREYLALKRQFFPDLLARTRKRHEEWEVKGNDLTGPHNAASRRRQAFIQHLLRFLGNHSAALFCVTFVKDSVNPVNPYSMYTQALQILTERFSLYLGDHPVYSEGFMICDSRMKGMSGGDIQVARSHMSYVFGHQTGRTFINLVEAPLFADSRLTVGLQLVDIAASLLYTSHYRYYLRNEAGALNYDHITAFWPSLDNLQFKSRQMVDGYYKFGYRVVDLRNRGQIQPAAAVGDVPA